MHVALRVSARFGGALALLALGATALVREARPLTIATYNIRRFGVEPTDLERLTAVLASVDADVLAVQEIQSPSLLREVASRLSRGGRRYAIALTACGGRSEMHVGFVYDTRRIALDGTREFAELDPDGAGRCSDGERAALLAELHARDGAGQRFRLLTIHLTAGGSAEHAARRRQQWAAAFAIADRHRDLPIAILGDTNSTGWLDDRHGERAFLRDRAASHGYEIATTPLACSEYFHPPEGGLEPSLLDHVVALPGLVRPGSARVHGFCAELACRAQPPGPEPPEFATVSDHCPVSVESLLE